MPAEEDLLPIPFAVVAWGILLFLPLLFLPTLKQVFQEKMASKQLFNTDNLIIILIYVVYYLVLITLIIATTLK